MKCVFLALLVQIVASQSCYENSDRLIGSRCYKFINQKLSYQDARNWCHSRSSYLATVPDLYTDNFLASTALTLFNDNAGKFWIGLSRSNNKWTWDDGTPYVWNNWEIQNSQNYATESIKNGKWNGYTPDTRLNFVCSYFPNGGPTPGTSSAPDTPTTATATTEAQTTPYLVSLIGAVFSACFDNGDKEIGGSCYKFVPQKLTFADAQYWCHYQNPVTSSYLAYVPNQFTSNFLASYARSAFETDDGNFWIGLSRKSSSSPWIWDNGQPLGFSNFGGQLGQNFAAESIVNAKWNAFGINDKNFFVCSYDPQAPPTFGPPVTDIPVSTVPVSTEVPPTPTAGFEF
ncbi:hypothetical protein L5515_012862 [Caenorhabditis briggsae]|uniref:C-type lectin domain-containing protein n=1 Tax=Caenorhabditis briggsae TaxID=6238 RepID=A0AAE9F290_CAEBR|nr:hypothetical protein L5515_012862 [Caenorhabditis briggsae]